MGSGFADIPMVWSEFQTVVYNTISPLISLATIGWIAASVRQKPFLPHQKEKAYLLVFSILQIQNVDFELFISKF